ncbi:MAG: STAS domain-containing protein [Thermoleophilia bacterium]
MTTETHPGGRGGIVTVTGELDIAAVPAVSHAVAALESGSPPHLVLDLSGVVHLDSSGLRVLLDASARAGREGRRLVIVAPPDGPVGRLLELTLLAEHLDVVRDLDAACP